MYISSEMKKTIKNKNLVNDYFQQEINVGGKITTVGKFIFDFQKANIPQKCIDMYLFGILSKENQ